MGLGEFALNLQLSAKGALSADFKALLVSASLDVLPLLLLFMFIEVVKSVFFYLCILREDKIYYTVGVLLIFWLTYPVIGVGSMLFFDLSHTALFSIFIISSSLQCIFVLQGSYRVLKIELT